MFKFAFFFISAVLLASQAEARVAPLEDGIIDSIKKVVAAIEQAVDWLLAKVDAMVDAVDDDYESVEAKIADIAVNVTQKVLDRVNSILTKIAENSDTAGQKLAQCVIDSESASLDVVSDFVTSLLSCAEDELSNLISDLTPFVKDLKRNQKQYKTILTNIDSCEGSDVTALLCVAQVLGNLVEEVIKDIPAMKADLAPVINDMPEVKAAVVKCYNTVIPDTLTKAAGVLSTVAACASA